MPRDPNIPDAFDVFTQSDATLRGLSIFNCGLDEAARLSDADPMVQAGWLAYEVME